MQVFIEKNLTADEKFLARHMIESAFFDFGIMPGDDYSIHIEYGDQQEVDGAIQNRGADGCMTINKNDNRQALIIILKGKSLKRFLEVLAHELIHVRQYFEGSLQADGNRGLYWKGKAWSADVIAVAQAATDPRILPWENEAYAMMYGYANRAIERLPQHWRDKIK